MFETIIVPLDGSSTAEVTLPYAAEIAARMGSELVLLFVREPNDYRSENILQCYADSLAARARQNALPFLQASGGKEIKTQVKILTGNPAEEIINFAEKQPGAQLMMATHGQSGPGTRWNMGSVVDKVVRATSAPVSIIRASGSKPEVHGPIHVDKILAPLDGSRGSEATLPIVKNIAQRLKASVTFLEVIKSAFFVHNLQALSDVEETRKAVQEYLESKVREFQAEGISASYDIIETRDDIGEAINEYTKQHTVDTVIMATHSRSRPGRILFGSVTNEVMMEGNTPLMLIKTGG